MASSEEPQHGHGHGVAANADQRYLAGALTLIVGFMAVEVIIGTVTSAALLLRLFWMSSSTSDTPR